MKHNLLKSLIISVILLTGVSNAWALDIYLDLGTITWSDAGAIIKLYPGTGSDVQGSPLSLPSGLSVYKFTVQQATGTMWFKRINPNDPNNTWNQASIDYDAYQNNLYKLTGWESVKNADYSISTVTPFNYIYFDNSITNWTSTNKYFVIGHDKPSAYSIAYTMYKIENTQLWYTHNLGNSWTDATYYSFFADNDAWSGNSWGISNIPTADAYTAPFTSHKNLIAGKYYLCCPTNKNNDQPFNISEYSSYTDLNYTQTIKAQVKYGETNTAYQQVISPATITATTHYFGSDYTKVDQTGSLTINRGETDPAKLTQTVNAAYTSTVTLSYTNLHDAYEFMDWWDDTNQKTISTSATCTYVATKAATIYARFKTKENYTHKIYLDARNWNEHQPRYAVYAYYGEEVGQFEWIDMTAACGTNWYYTCEVPAKYSHVIFCRMNPENNNNTFNDDSRWGQTKDLLLLLDLDVNNCFTPDKDPDNSINGKTYNGSWSTPPTFTVTLEATSNGSFLVTCNGEKKTEETINNVPVGTPLTITNIQPNPGYDQTMVYSAGKYTEFDNYEVDNQGNRTYTYTVTSDVSIAEDFRTKEAHTIFVKVPKGNASAYWEDLRIIPMNGITQSKAGTEESVNEFAEPMEVWQNINEYILYYFTIPAGNHSFKLYPANNTTASKSFWYEILPKDGTKDINQNCWVIDNKESNTNADGTWVASKVYLDPCKYGTYGIKYNGEEYLNYATTSREIEMPYGSSIQIIDATPTSDHYRTNPRYETSVVKYTTDNIINSASEIKQNEIINVYGDNLKFAPNLVTKNTHRVFLHIPKDLKQIWGEVDNETNFNTIYLMDYLSYWRIALPTNPNPNFPYGRLEKMSALETFAADEDEYYYIDIPEGYHTFVFERKHKDALVQYGQPWIKSIILHYGIPTDENNNCFTIIDETGDENRQKGTWGPLPNYTVTLGYCEFGRYGVVYDGKTYYSKDRSDVVIENVPLGTELQILPGEPASDKYNGNLTYEITENDKKVKRDLTTSTYTVTQDVTIDDNFVTNVDIPVYLGIPTALTDWTPGENNMEKDDMALYVWRTDSYNDGTTFGLTNVDLGSSYYEKDGIAYYQFTLGKGCNDFQFQLKNLKRREGTNGQNNGTTYRQSQWFRFQIPLTNVNCFVLDVNNYGSYNSTTYTYTGYWTTLPQQEKGDYRLRYIEQTLTLVDGHPHTEEVYSHCSDIIKANDPEEKRTLYSLHIFNEMDEEKTYGGEIIQGLNNPAIVVEKWDGSQWVEQMRHMVFGPLRGDFSLAAMPGRRNESPIDPYDNGIENIKNDLKNIEAYSNSGTSFYIGKDNPEETDYKRYIENWGNDNCSGVWNFVVNRDDAGNINTQDPLLLEKTHRYDGTYYIRTIGTIGGWDNYTIPENHMTRTNISKTNSNFSHYFCKWLTKNVNVRYVIANDYNLAISDDLKADKTTLMGKPIGDNDKIVADDEELPTNVNVRFSWNEKTNFLHRAYLSGSTHVQDRFLVLGGSGDGRLLDKDGNDLKAGEDTGSDPRYGLNANEEIFQDISNWIYYTDVQMIPLAEVKLTALIKYKKDEQDKRIEQYFVGTSDEWNNTLLQGRGEKEYLIRVLYDFKTNQMTSAYVPDRGENEDIEPIQTNLMLIRREEPKDEDSNVTQLVFKEKEMDNSNTRAYGVLELSKDRLVNDGKYNDLRRRLYWISFPFDVRIADVFGSCVYGQHWIIQSYNGQKRADNGYYYETTESNWEYHFDPNTINEGDPIYEGVLKKGVGYVVALNLYNIWKDQLLENTKDAICLYFPSKDLISADIVQNQNITIDVPEHKCTKPGREIADSHWNVIGVPAYKNAGVNFTQEIDLSTDFAYYYRWDKAHNAYTPMANFGKEDDEKFSTLHAYMVQYHGELNWTGVLRESNQQHLAARKDVDNQKEYNLRLEVQKNGTELDRTFVKLQEDDVTALFDFNYDLCKITNAGANIYSFTSDATPIKVAGNVQPLAEDIVIPVGVVIDQAGDYTFSMPDGTAGIEVQLIDYQTNEKTNLLFGDYTINLPKGTFDNRFALLINPDKTATSVDNIGAEAEGVKKYIIDGQLYLQQGSALYDAQGHTVR